MSEYAIQVENLSKRYRIGTREKQHDTLISAALTWLKSPVDNFRQLRRLSTFSGTDEVDVLWAVRDISFEVKQGEVVGIIGRNGAGKSTLLKILARITPPTSGRVLLNGRVASLLEVGTGFHPELTGRENIYLNGTILGMTTAEVNRKFNEIVDFSGVEKFIDTPVKWYSSGMKVRLAFSVAAYLEPEILLIDEVLAVGDMEFQRKCLGKMQDVAHQGRTVLFISHNMSAVKSLCSKGILLTQGSVQLEGLVDEVISSYLGNHKENSMVNLSDRADRTGGDLLRFTEISILNSRNERATNITSGEAIRFAISYTCPQKQPLKNVSVSIRIEDMLDQYIFTLATEFTGDDFTSLPPNGTIICRVPALQLVSGEYKVYLWCSANGEVVDAIENATSFFVVKSNIYGSGKFPAKHKHGLFVVPHSWEFENEGL